jgi:hypothetical protein
MSQTKDQTALLAEDADLEQPLRRVSYQAGMLLGLDAARDEQRYHRQRLNRQQYWSQGSGTLAGMAVTMSPSESETNDPILTRLLVSPGVGIDGLGREVLIHEDYCIDLGDWLKAQSETSLRNGYDEAQERLWLKVTVRYQECPIAAQPVLARKLNLSTDAVQPSRIADSIALELVPELPPEPEQNYKPWANHPPLSDDAPPLTDTESAYLDQVSTGNSEAGRQLQLQARLLHALTDGLGTQLTREQLISGARLLLARVAIRVSDLNSILEADSNTQVVNPNDIDVNNLVRPFVLSAGHLAHLQQTPDA